MSFWLVRHNFFFTHMFAKKLFKTMKNKQTTVFIAIKRRPNFSIINYLFNLCCSLTAKSILKVSKIYKDSLLFDFVCGHEWSFVFFYVTKTSFQSQHHYLLKIWKQKWRFLWRNHSFLQYGSTLAEMRDSFVLMFRVNFLNRFCSS